MTANEIIGRQCISSNLKQTICLDFWSILRLSSF